MVLTQNWPFKIPLFILHIASKSYQKHLLGNKENLELNKIGII